MFRHLLINTIASAGAFFTVSVVSFLLIPVLVGAYGLKEFGLILLARLFLPNGVLVLFDFGFSEIASQLVAEARETKSWIRASAAVSILFAAAVGVGVMLGLLLALGAEHIALLFGADGAAAEAFAAVLRATALAMPLLFMVAVLEGIVKGYGAFRSLRLIEVVCTLAYAAVALILVTMRSPYEAVAYAFLVLTLAKGAMIAANALRAGLGSELKITLAPGQREFGDLLPRCKVMAQNRLLGVLQGPAQQALVGLFVSPAGVAMYDVLTKLPRFAKAAIGLFGSALIPVAARLDASKDTLRMSKLAGWGLLLTSSVTIPPLAGAALMSEPLLRLWVGSTFAAYWYWHSLMFIVPGVAALLSFGSAALLVRPQAMAQVNKIGSIQLACQYAFALVILGHLQERAFVLAQCVSVVVACAFMLWLLTREHQLEQRLLWRVTGIGGIGVVMAALYVSLLDPRTIEGWTTLGSHFAGWCSIYWMGIWLLVLDKAKREGIRTMAWSLYAPLQELGGSRK